MTGAAIEHDAADIKRGCQRHPEMPGQVEICRSCHRIAEILGVVTTDDMRLAAVCVRLPAPDGSGWWYAHICANCYREAFGTE